MAGLISYLIWLAQPHIEGKDAIEVAKMIVGLGGGLLALVVFAFLALLALLWLIFPFFVYHQLNRIIQESIRMRECSERIEDHVRRFVEMKRSD